MSWIIQNSYLPCSLLPTEQKPFYTLVKCAILFLCWVIWLSSLHSKQPEQLPLIYFSNLKEHSGDDVLIHTTNHAHSLNVMYQHKALLFLHIQYTVSWFITVCIWHRFSMYINLLSNTTLKNIKCLKNTTVASSGCSYKKRYST